MANRRPNTSSPSVVAGITRSLSSRAKVERINEHRIELRIPYAFPERPPDVRWLSSIYHPNISFSGLVKLRDIGLPWVEDMSLDVVCERLWDVARLAYFDEEHASKLCREEVDRRADRGAFTCRPSPAARQIDAIFVECDSLPTSRGWRGTDATA